MGYLKINIVVCIEMNAHKDKGRLPLNDTKLTLYIYISKSKMYKYYF